MERPLTLSCGACPWICTLQIVTIMDRHPQHRRLQGAACQALASLAGVSLAHCEHVARLGLSRVYTATLNHKESQTIAMSLCSLIALLASIRQCRAALQPKMVDMVRQFIGRHRNVSEVLAAACAALTKLDTLFPLTNEVQHPCSTRSSSVVC